MNRGTPQGVPKSASLRHADEEGRVQSIALVLVII